MAYKIYQQLESGMGTSALTESTEVGYTQNAEKNATRFDGNTVAGALDNINNTILSLSQPYIIAQPVIRLEYKKSNNESSDYILTYSNSLESPLSFEKGESMHYKAQYYWVKNENDTTPSRVLNGDWVDLPLAGALSNEITGNIEDSHSISITIGKDRQGLILDKDNMIRPSITTDYSSAKIDIIFNKRVYFGESVSYIENPQDILNLSSDLLIDNSSSKQRDFELNLPNNKLFIYAYPKSWGESKIYLGGDNHRNAWVCETMQITTALGYIDEYYVYYCYKGAYKNNQQINFL